MHKFGSLVVRFRKAIIAIALVLMIPSAIGYFCTGVNYDMLTYLPETMDTVAGQQILKDDFGKGAFALVVTEGMEDSAVKDLTEKIGDVEHVVNSLSYGNIANANVPDELFPEGTISNLKNGDAQMIAVFFDTGTSSNETMDAIDKIRGLADQTVFVSGMGAMVTDLKHIAEREEPIYVILAVLFALIILLLLTDAWLAPFIFLASIGMAIVYNMGSNVVLGDISYITKCLAAILQLAVTMDYSIFLWHGYEEKLKLYPNDHNKAMALAIGDTLTALTSSMLTASAGFLALCFMSYTLGGNLGIVMAKGCLIGFIASCTILPALILAFDKPLLKSRHKGLIPNADKFAELVTNKYWVVLLAFCVISVPAAYGFLNKPVYYNVSDSLVGEGSTLPDEDVMFHVSDEKLKEHFDVSTTEMILCDSNMSHVDGKEMLNRIKAVEGVKYVIGYDSLVGGQLNEDFVPEKVKEALINGDWQLILINSEYKVASDEVNDQVQQINDILKEYDEDGMLIGEAPATKDLIATTDFDFMLVDIIAILAILLILFVVFRSVSLPFLLVLCIEFAIFINLGIPFFTSNSMSFIEPICISTIQLGSTVNYAILVTTRYKRERRGGAEKQLAVKTALSTSLPAVATSALSFFAATFCVGVYSNVGLIGDLCGLMARGAVISMFSVLLVLPAAFMLFDKLIIKTSLGFKPKGNKTPETIAIESLS